MQRIAVELNLDPLDVIRRNLVPAGAFPYRTATGALLDSGDYRAAFEQALSEGGLAELRARQKQARAEGRLYGIGFTAVVEPSVSNMGYITTVLTPEERRKAGPKNGAQATATIALDPVGACRCMSPRCRRDRATARCWRRSSPMRSGSKPSDIRVVTDIDTREGRLVDRVRQLFEPLRRRAVGGAAQLAADKLATSSAQSPPRSSTCGRRRSSSRAATCAAHAAIPTMRCRSSRVAAASHWSPGTAAGRQTRRCAKPCSGRRRN